MTQAPTVHTEGLTKAYGRRVALRDLDLEIEVGEIFGYLGPNGAGRTSTLRLLAGMGRPTSRRTQVLGYDPWRDSVQVHRQMGYLSGEPAPDDRLTGREHAQYLGSLRGKVTPQRVQELPARLDLDLDRPCRELSKGNRQKLALVPAMMSCPRLLILDDPRSTSTAAATLCTTESQAPQWWLPCSPSRGSWWSQPGLSAGATSWPDMHRALLGSHQVRAPT